MPKQDRKFWKCFPFPAQLIKSIFSFSRISQIFDVSSDVIELFLVVINERGFLTLACEVAILVGIGKVRGIVYSHIRLGI